MNLLKNKERIKSGYEFERHIRAFGAESVSRGLEKRQIEELRESIEKTNSVARALLRAKLGL